MVVDFAFVCDYADVQSAKINALSIGFDTIFAPELPATHPFFSLIARLRASIAEAGSKSLVVRLIDADGQDVISPIEGSFEMPRPGAWWGVDGQNRDKLRKRSFPSVRVLLSPRSDPGDRNDPNTASGGTSSDHSMI